MMHWALAVLAGLAVGGVVAGCSGKLNGADGADGGTNATSTSSSGADASTGGAGAGPGGSSSGLGAGSASSGGISGSGGGSGSSSGALSGSSGGSVSSSGALSGSSSGVLLGVGAACTPLTDEWVGAILTLNVTWPAVLAANGGSGDIYIWTLAHYTINGSTIAGTWRTCGSQVPPLVLNATGTMATGLPSTTTNASFLFETPTMRVWDDDTRTAPANGILGGWNIGSSITILPTTMVQGLAAASPYTDPTTGWPQSGMTIPVSDLVDDDNDGAPGITEYALNDNAAGYYLPSTGLGTGQPVADKLFVVSRTEVSLYGTSTSCTQTSGTISVPAYDLHVVGCHEQNGSDCTAAEWQFLDGNVTSYRGTGGANSTITGTFDAKQLASGNGGVPTCDDVIATFPSPMPQPQADTLGVVEDAGFTDTGSLPQLAAPTFAPLSGTIFTGPGVVTIKAPAGFPASGSIYYTTNGTNPNPNSQVVISPLNVSLSEEIRAYASAPGFQDSPISSAMYAITANATTCAPDATVMCNSATGYSCTGSDTPAQADSALTCSAGVAAAQGGNTDYCCAG